MPLLSVIIPAYNEAGTIKQILEKVNSVNIDKEIVVIENGSTDDTGKILRDIKYPNLKIIYHLNNRGKGGAILTGLANATGEYLIIQDADLEYDPADFLKLVQAIKENSADLVIGARFTKGYHGTLMPRMGNRSLTALLNLLFNVRFNDCYSCYKLFRKETINKLNLNSLGFDIEIEIITKAIKNKMKIVEVPISYYPRTYKQGKKIRVRDGLHGILTIFKYRFSR